MHTIEITTTQNVVIQYNPASLMDRILAFLVDFIMIVLFYYVLMFMMFAIMGFNDFDQTPILLPLMIVSFYSLLFERFMDGQTPGKRLLHIQVIKVDGGQPDGVEFFKRWSLRFLDIYLSFGALAMISSGSSEKGQRLGDKIADTMVVKVQRGAKYRLEDIIKLGRSSEYEAHYPEILMLDEKHIINLKRLVKRYERSKASSFYTDLMLKTVKHLEEELGIESKQHKPVDFVRQLVRDYVILTR
jgi:uncharacterized RDD family membrane protein YckC